MNAPQISIAEYLRYATQYPAECTAQLRINAAETVSRLNSIYTYATASGVVLTPSPRTQSLLTSGWRPRAINARTKGAAVFSRHMSGEAGDTYDPHGDFDDYCYAHQQLLEEIGLWMEHPAATKGYTHLQIVPPRSKRRVFYP